jgi:ATP-dependent RNA circularization protein (DNA/RNA ligase family)
MIEHYPKIKNIFNFDEKYRSITGIQEPFNTLRDITWIGTEKVDGTNTRVIWDGHTITVKPRLDTSAPAKFIVDFWNETFCTKEMEYIFEQEFGEDEVILFGETFGPKVQTNGELYSDKLRFCLFDIYHANGWWRYEGVKAFADRLGLFCAPIVFRGTLNQAIDFVKGHQVSTINPNHEMEGIVLEPEVDGLYGRDCFKLKCKCKYQDLVKTNSL